MKKLEKKKTLYNSCFSWSKAGIDVLKLILAYKIYHCNGTLKTALIDDTNIKFTYCLSCLNIVGCCYFTLKKYVISFIDNNIPNNKINPSFCNSDMNCIVWHSKKRKHYSEEISLERNYNNTLTMVIL